MTKTNHKAMKRRYLYPVLLLLGLSVCGQSAAGAPIPTQGEASGGSISDGLDVGEIRLGRHSGFERLVFDVTYWEGAGKAAGQAASSPGHFRIQPLVAGQEYVIELGGFRALSAHLPRFAKDSRILSLSRRKGEAFEDDSTLSLRLAIRPGLCYRAFTLDNPARIVVDVADCP